MCGARYGWSLCAQRWSTTQGYTIALLTFNHKNKIKITKNENDEAHLVCFGITQKHPHHHRQFVLKNQVGWKSITSLIGFNAKSNSQHNVTFRFRYILLLTNVQASLSVKQKMIMSPLERRNRGGGKNQAIEPKIRLSLFVNL